MGTKDGGKAAAKTNKANDPDFYRIIGSKGGRNSHTGGFWHAKYVLNDTEKVSAMGRIGGKLSRRKAAQ